ncbi:WecB/TagA/CpsF family glycosyltransferase [Desulfobacter latus]|uniref:WecB/TagA/CpsF family glycosyltransferase n=1 Tax=Desulfobacter latus TaxID=2292 RepID=A0A850T0B6_9BACT|nr:WecB/TagA/CpsF family glycosyltransferase [Desulfobacter latus]NWH05780.1 WecB/TagA/CpsF family glycosyltransferase [Desulfobacter latus]
MQNKLIEQANFFGLRVSIFTYENLVEYIKESLKHGTSVVYYGYSMGTITRFRPYPELYHYINDYDLMVTDGRLFYLLAKLCGLPLKYDISIPYLTELVLEVGNEKHASVMIIGSTEKKNNNASQNLRNKFKNLTVYEGYTGGDFSDRENDKTVSYVNKYNPDILLIGVSNPKKEYFTFKNKTKLNVKIIIPCGGMVDILAGEVARIPKTVKKLGFGWLWRIVLEPNRFLKDKLNQSSHILLKIIPLILFNRYLKNRSNFFIPSIYAIPNRNRKIRNSYSSGHMT